MSKTSATMKWYKGLDECVLADEKGLICGEVNTLASGFYSAYGAHFLGKYVKFEQAIEAVELCVLPEDVKAAYADSRMAKRETL